MYIVFKTIIFILTLTIPYWFPKLYGSKLHRAPWWLLVFAGLLWVFSGQLPDIHISRETNTFQEHFVGGGMYCACLFVYFLRALGLRLRWWSELLLLFAITSSLGVANELFEFIADKTNIIPIDISDTSWDLIANTTGALAGFLLLWPFRGKRNKKD
jgi:hypothetical protein